MCCTLAGPLVSAIAQTLRLAKPHRLIIEPSGLGHPGGLIDALRSEHLAPALDITSIICCVDLSTQPAWNPDRYEQHDLLRDQVHSADYLVGTKSDAAAPGSIETFRTWAETILYPSKRRVEACPSADAPLSLLDGPAESLREFEFRAPHSTGDGEASTSAPVPVGSKELGGLQGTRHQGVFSCGWLFGPSHIISRAKVEAFAREAVQRGAGRVKGVFRSSQRTWLALNVVGGQSQSEAEVKMKESAYRRDQRLEIVVEKPNVLFAEPGPGGLVDGLEAILFA